FLFFIVLLSILLVYFIERSACFFLRSWVTNGKRHSFLARIKPMVFFIVMCTIGFTIISLVILVIWSLTWQWRFPDFLPSAWTLKFWAKGLVSSFDPVITTLFTGMAAAFIGLVLTIGCLEHDVISRKNQARHNQVRNYNKYLHYFLYLPLLVPQITFMAGIQLLLVIMKLDGF
ncbi:MAG: hypothetical protein K8S18_16400, partial [Desulfobacula sp.]|nr:hypothetical protein [Desulfobacula sp.]